MQSLVNEKSTLSGAYDMFCYSMHNELTRRYYERRLKKFLDYIEFEVQSDFRKRCDLFSEKARADAGWTLTQIISFLQFQKSRVQNKEISAATLRNFVKAVKLLCEMSDVQVPWKKIAKGLPRARAAANDRAPTIEEIRKLVEYPDRRIKPVVYVMISSGIRLGAWEYLLWKHISPIMNPDGEIIAAKIVVYAGDVEEYYAFITPEAYLSLKSWMDFRASYGEKITGDSFLMRDLWQTTNVNYGAKWGLATNPRILKSSGIKRLIERALWEQGIRQPLLAGSRRHEWKAAHGFRKFYKTRTEQVMRPINVEITMGHNIGLSASYYKPTENDVLADYLNAVDLLTIDNNERNLQKKVEELEDENKNSKYIIKGKLEERDKQISVLMKKQEQFEMLIQSLIDTGQIKPYAIKS